MTAAQRLSPADRNRATERLRSITLGVTLAGMTATLGFSVVAALSNPGTSVAATTTIDSSSSGSGSDSSTSSDDGGATTTTPSQSSLGLGSSGSGGTHAVSGGS
jgi:hypothetical protein